MLWASFASLLVLFRLLATRSISGRLSAWARTARSVLCLTIRESRQRPREKGRGRMGSFGPLQKERNLGVWRMRVSWSFGGWVRARNCGSLTGLYGIKCYLWYRGMGLGLDMTNGVTIYQFELCQWNLNYVVVRWMHHTFNQALWLI